MMLAAIACVIMIRLLQLSCNICTCLLIVKLMVVDASDKRVAVFMLCGSLFHFQEKHAKKPSPSLDSKFFTDKRSHLYTLGMIVFVAG